MESTQDKDVALKM